MRPNKNRRFFYFLSDILSDFLSDFFSDVSGKAKGLSTLMPVMLATGLMVFLPGFRTSNQPTQWAWPTLLSGEKITKHMAYTVSYNHKHMQANWVAYELTMAHTMGAAERESRFVIDPIISPHTARTEDYTKSGFDRGHLAPAADMKYSEQAMKESFYTSNISPQRPGLNRGIWKQLEEKIRDWAPANRPLFIATGPVLNEPLEQFIGNYNRITVPKRFFKVILDTAQPVRAIGFVFPNTGSALPLASFALSVDAVEQITGRDFFPNLPDIQEASIENNFLLTRWDFH